MGLLGILIGLGLLVWLAFRGWSVLLLAPAAGLVAALFGGQPLLASWTQIFMSSAARFLAQFFPLFLLGAVFGKLMDDSGSVSTVAQFMTRTMGQGRAMLALVLAGAMVTYGGVSLFVAFFVLVPMAQELFRAAAIPRRLIPAAVVLGTSTFTMSAMPGTPSIQNAIPMPFFVVLVFWLMVIFGSFCLFAQTRPLVIATVFVFALSVSSALFLIVDLSYPFEGLMQVSDHHLRVVWPELDK